MSAPPDNRSANRMSGQHQEPSPQQEQSSNVRHIPIFVEGRDEPVINKTVDHGTHFGETKQTYVPPPQPHIDRDQYFADDTPHGFHHPPNFSRAFGTPFNKGFRQAPQPFTQQKMYPQNAFARGTSPQRSQSPKPQKHPEEHFVKVPVFHEQSATPSKPQPKQPSPQRASPSPKPAQQAPQAPPKPKPQPAANDPITQILSIQSDVLNLMTEVENFTGTKTDKKYIYLDEMLTRNLIKLDNIETEGKENIRQARKEAIKCIQKCINVLEAKAEQGSAPPQPQDVEMHAAIDKASEEETVHNGDVEMKEAPQEKEMASPQAEQVPQIQPQENEPLTEPEKTMETESITIEQAPVKSESTQKMESTPADTEAVPQTQPETEKAQLETMKPEPPQVTDTRPIDTKTPEPEVKSETKEVEKKSPKKVTKIVKKRDKSKDKTAKEAKDTANKEAVKDNKETEADSNKQEIIDKIENPLGTKGNGDSMEVEGGASQ